MPSCSGPILTQKLRDKVNSGAVFSHLMPKVDFYFSIVFVGKNTLKWQVTCHGYINNHQSPLIGPLNWLKKIKKLLKMISHESPNYIEKL